MEKLKEKLEEAHQDYLKLIEETDTFEMDEMNPFYQAYENGWNDGYFEVEPLKISLKVSIAKAEELQRHYDRGYKDGFKDLMDDLNWESYWYGCD